MAEIVCFGYDEIQTSSITPEGDYDVIISNATGKPDGNGKMRVYYTARVTKAYDQKNAGVVGFNINGQPQIRMAGDDEWKGKELKQILEAAHIPYSKDNNGNVRFDTDNWINREMTVTVKHTKNGDKTYANMTAFREKSGAQSAPVQPAPMQSAPVMPGYQTQPQMPPVQPQMAQPQMQYTQPAPTVPQYAPQQNYAPAPQYAQPQNVQVPPQTPPQPMWGSSSKRS